LAELDIVIPVYNEGANIRGVLGSLAEHVKTPFRVLICYDRDDDDTLAALDQFSDPRCPVVRVKNRGRGAFGAVVTGFAESEAPAVLVFPADDDYNAPRLDAMVARFKEGHDIVCASRFIPGGKMVGCPWLKATIVRSSAFVLHHAARLPAHDPSNGFRLFSRRLLRSIPLEATTGFTYSIELLVKCHRLGWRIAEVPVEWHERTSGRSRFQVIRWLPAYFTWFRYAFETTYLGRGPGTVTVRENEAPGSRS
jgi:glycosyltransferase involved in cell wall biosynthesis